MTHTDFPASTRTIDQHLGAVLGLVSPARPERVSVRQLGGASGAAGGYVRLAADATALVSVPPAHVSAVDGFVAHAHDLAPGVRLAVAGDIPAGHPPLPVPPGQAVRIMTGAPVPATSRGELKVVPVEDTDARRTGPAPDTVTVRAVRTGRDNIRHAGEHLRVGDTVAPAGTPVDPGTLAALISAGVEEVEAFPKPRVAVVTTGDELAPAAAHDPGQPSWTIPNSNGPMLAGLARRFGASTTHHHVPDSEAALAAALDRLSGDRAAAAPEADLIVTAGGISAGAFDIVKSLGRRATAQRRARFDFYPIAMHPGKPQGCGLWGTTPVICLPGNPVAAWVSAVLFLAPAIRRLAGAAAPHGLAELPHTFLEVAEPVATRDLRAVARPARIDWGRARAVFSPARGSHMVGSLAGADGVCVVERGKLGPGDQARILLV